MAEKLPGEEVFLLEITTERSQEVIQLLRGMLLGKLVNVSSVDVNDLSHITPIDSLVRVTRVELEQRGNVDGVASGELKIFLGDSRSGKDKVLCYAIFPEGYEYEYFSRSLLRRQGDTVSIESREGIRARRLTLITVYRVWQ